jgi:hypothetical protein
MTQTQKRSPTFVPAQAPGDYEITSTVIEPQQPITIPTAQPAPMAIDTRSRSAHVVTGRPQDQAQALLLRFAIVFGIVLVTNGAIFIFATLKTALGSGEAVPLWLLLSGLMGILAWIKMDASDKEHSPAGTERHKVDRAAQAAVTMNKDREETTRHAIDRYYDAIGEQNERDHQLRLSQIERDKLTG